MKKVLSAIFILLPAMLFGQQPVDRQANEETKALYKNLALLAGTGFMFGHQDDDAYGVGWKAVEGRSDVKAVTGSFPGVHGWDLGKIEYQRAVNLDSVDFKKMHDWIRQAYVRGGVNTISWHVDNPVTKKSAWDKTSAVREILPGGSQHDYFVKQLDHVADFLERCTSGSTAIPIIFRPWHEHNGDWFWWGKGNCTEQEYIQLYRFTVTYLRDVRKIHQLLYAFSPDRSRMDLKDPEGSYLYGWPGDDYVDVTGLDDYMDVGLSKTPEEKIQKRDNFVTVLKLISQIAERKNKVAALTETGQESVTDPLWYSDVLLKAIKSDKGIRIAYALVWRNFNKKHHYVPYEGHPSADDFRVFYNDPTTFFESDVKDVYH